MTEYFPRRADLQMFPTLYPSQRRASSSSRLRFNCVNDKKKKKILVLWLIVVIMSVRTAELTVQMIKQLGWSDSFLTLFNPEHLLPKPGRRQAFMTKLWLKTHYSPTLPRIHPVGREAVFSSPVWMCPPVSMTHSVKPIKPDRRWLDWPWARAAKFTAATWRFLIITKKTTPVFKNQQSDFWLGR